METSLLMAKSSRPAFRRTFIKQWREYRNLSQAALAELMGVSDGYVNQIENASRRYNQEMLEAAAEALGVTPAVLLSRAPPREGEEDPNDIWNIWDKLSEDERALVSRMVGSLRRN